MPSVVLVRVSYEMDYSTCFDWAHYRNVHVLVVVSLLLYRSERIDRNKFAGIFTTSASLKHNLQ